MNHFGDLLAAAETLQADDASKQDAHQRRMMAISLAGGPPPTDEEPMNQLERHYHHRALHAWRHMRLVRAGWFTAEEAMAYLAYFATHLQPMTPMVISEYLQPRKQPELLMNEPVLTVAILLITSRHMRLRGHSHQTRAFLVHEALWNYLRNQMQRLMWAQEQFGGGFTGAGASDVREGPLGQIIWQGSLRTLGTVEALLLLSDWQPRGLNFPPGNDDDLLLGADYRDGELTNGHAKQEQASSTLQSEPYASWLEPVWRSDKMSWMIIGAAQTLAFELGVFDLDLHKVHKDPERQRKLRLRKLVLINVSQISGRIGLVPSPLTLDQWLLPDELDTEGPADQVLTLWFEIAHLMNHVNSEIFPSKEYTRNIITSSEYRKLIAQFGPRLVKWKERFDAHKASMHQVTQAILLMEYEYARLYLNSLGFQSVVSRLLSDNDSQSSMLARSKLVAENQTYIDELTEAACNLLDRFTIDLGDGGLINAPVRTFLRALSAMMFAMKRLSLGADEKVVRRIIKRLERSTLKLGKEVVDDVHLSAQMSRLMQVLVDKVKKTLIRVERAPNTSNAASRDMSHSASPNHEAGDHMHRTQAENDPAMTLPQVSSALTYGNHDPLAGIRARPMTDLQDKTFVPPPNYNTSTQEFDFDQILGDSNVDPTVISGDPGDWFAADIGNIWNSPLAQADQGAHSIGPTVGNRDWIELVHGNLGPAAGDANTIPFPLDSPGEFYDYQAPVWGRR